MKRAIHREHRARNGSAAARAPHTGADVSRSPKRGLDAKTSGYVPLMVGFVVLAVLFTIGCDMIIDRMRPPWLVRSATN
jgi:hypothetical protein